MVEEILETARSIQAHLRATDSVSAVALPLLLQGLAYAARFNMPGTGIGVTNRDWRC